MTLMKRTKDVDYFTQLIYEALEIIEREREREKEKELLINLISDAVPNTEDT